MEAIAVRSPFIAGLSLAERRLPKSFPKPITPIRSYVSQAIRSVMLIRWPRSQEIWSRKRPIVLCISASYFVSSVETSTRAVRGNGSPHTFHRHRHLPWSPSPTVIFKIPCRKHADTLLFPVGLLVQHGLAERCYLRKSRHTSNRNLTRTCFGSTILEEHVESFV